MTFERDECCGCAVPAYPCLGSGCSQRHVKVYECDCCHDEVEGLFHFDNQELCLDCIQERLEPVK